MVRRFSARTISMSRSSGAQRRQSFAIFRERRATIEPREGSRSSNARSARAMTPGLDMLQRYGITQQRYRVNALAAMTSREAPALSNLTIVRPPENQIPKIDIGRQQRGKLQWKLGGAHHEERHAKRQRQKTRMPAYFIRLLVLVQAAARPPRHYDARL